MSNSGFNKIVFNGKPTKPRQLKHVVKAMSDKAILADKGGYIFSLNINDDTLHLGILPYFIGNERSRHYDIEIPEGKFNLIGFINANSSFELFFKLSQEDYRQGLDEEEVARFRKNYVRFAQFMVELKFPAKIELSFVTQDVLRELKIIPDPPKTIGELAKTPI